MTEYLVTFAAAAKKELTDLPSDAIRRVLPRIPSLPTTIAPSLSFRRSSGGAGGRAALRFLEFFTVNIRNRNTRAAYTRAAAAFLRWCVGQGVDVIEARSAGACGCV